MANLIRFILLILSLYAPLCLGASGSEDVLDPLKGSDDSQSEAPAKTQNTKAPLKVNAPKSHEYHFRNDADQHFAPDELKILLAGDTDFYVLFRDDMTGRPRGVALLVPDWGQNALNTRGIDFLRTSLNEYGWVTLSMTVPQASDPVFNTKITILPAGSQPAPTVISSKQPLNFADEGFMAQYEFQLKMRMMALTAEAENYQGYFVVIAQGSSAAVLASLYAKEELDEPEALILLSANAPNMAQNQLLNQNIAATAIPTLDIYQSRDSRWIHKNVIARRKLAKKQFKVAYRQKELHGDISYHNQNQRMLKIVYGWLSRMGL
jgi:hypothetical protein